MTQNEPPTIGLRVATLNLRREWDRWPERAPLVVAELAQLEPDLIGLQEVSVPLDQARWLASQAGSVYFVYQQPAPGLRGQREALAILSRWPAIQYDYVSLGKVPIVPRSLSRPERLAQRVRVEPAPGLFVDMVNTHLHYVSKHWLVRVRQVTRLVRWATGLDSAAQVLVGDFNDTPESEPIKRVKARLRSAYGAVHGTEPAYTDPTPLRPHQPSQRKTLDYIFVSPEARVLDARLAFDQPAPDDETLYPSDHFGLTADLEIGAG